MEGKSLNQRYDVTGREFLAGQLITTRLARVFFWLAFGYTKSTDNLEAKDMATKKKQVEETTPVAEQQLTEHQQAILEHYGPNSAEFVEAMRGE